MADESDREGQEGGDGGSFVIGLLTGTVLGAGLGMLFAPKSGSELRGQLSQQAESLAHTASDGYKKAAEAAGEWVEKGRGAGRVVYDRAREAVTRGTEEAERYVREAAVTPPGSPTPAGGSSPSSSEPVRATSPGQTRGSEPTTPRGPVGSERS